MINIEKLEHKAYFNIGNSEYYEGYHIKENRWNGFARPYFEKHIADLISHNFSTSLYKISYNPKQDCYIVTDKENMNTTEKAEKCTINTENGTKEVYDFGSLGWTWDDYTIDEARQISGAIIISKLKEPEKEENIDMDY